MLLFLDIESYYDSKSFTLKKMSAVEYCRDPRFNLFGMGIAFDNFDPIWVKGKDVKDFFQCIKLDEIDVVCHHTKFDLFALTTLFGIKPRSYIDTKGMSRAVLGKSVKNHSLATLAEHFGLQSKGVMKTDGKTELTEAEERELAEYCLHDVWLCREIYSQLANNFPESENKYMHQTIDMFVNPKLQLNVPLLEKTTDEENKRRENIFKEIGIEKAEFASNKKFPILLTRKGYEVPTKISPRTGKTIPAIALGDPEFLDLMENGNEDLRNLCEARVAAKSNLLETRSAKLAKIGSTGLWPFDVEFSGADQTHRFSGGSGAGGNPQNFTRDSALRKAVEAPEGYKLIVGDFSNIEMRLVAYLSKDPGLIQAIENNQDVYCDFASKFFGKKITKADTEQRRYGKTAILGLGYGMGWKKFQKTVRLQTGKTISDADAKRTVELYRSLYSKVPALWERLDGLIRVMVENAKPTHEKWNLPVVFVKGAVLLPSHLKIRFPNLRQEQGEREHLEWVYDVYRKGNLEKAKLYGGKLLENICQGLAGELCKTAMGKFEGLVVGQVHDELLLLVEDYEKDAAVYELKRAMEDSPSWMPELRLNAEVGYGQNWLEAK